MTAATLQDTATPFVEPAKLVGVYTWDVRTDRVYCDERVASYFDLPQSAGSEGAPLQSYLKAVLDEDVGALRRSIDNTFSGESLRQHYRVSSRQHGVRRLLAVGQCYQGPDARPSLCSGYLFDVTNDEQAGRMLDLKHFLTEARNCAHALKLRPFTYILEMLILDVTERTEKRGRTN
ncbi:MAG: hypothetical protein INR68_00880 [Methylobacterium mesophilicum]|nr:hypothetical protein [Methylobacterium mesophilicum]